MVDIGFIGLGNMGLPMALNLKKGGHNIIGFDAMPAARDAAQKSGLKLASSNVDAASNAQIVILMLPNGAIVGEVGKELLGAMEPQMLLIDCSTIDVTSAKNLHNLANKSNIHCLDAPVSGGVVGAEAGSLTFMVGGTKSAFDTGNPYFDIMGKSAVHCGDGGTGQAAKICNNMLLGISMIGTCEAFLLAQNLGLSQSALFDVMSTSSGSCWSVNTYCPAPGVGPKSPADNDYKPGFAAALMLKDLDLSQQAASESKISTPLGKHAASLYQQMDDAGLGGVDFSGMIKFLQANKIPSNKP